MPRRWYYSVTVTGEGNVKDVYKGKAAHEIVAFIQDSDLKPESEPAPTKRSSRPRRED